MERDDDSRLACVDWGGHRISRLIVGHNPLKGNSHYSDALFIERRMDLARDRLKLPRDSALMVGMWQKHRDQIGQNAALVRGILT